MIRRGVFLAALAAGAMPAAAADLRAWHPHVAAFSAACMPERQSFEGLTKAVAGQGWVAAEAAANPELAALMELSDEATGDPDVEARHAIYRRTAGEAELYLVALEVRSELIDLVSCYVYDFAAVAPLPKAELDALFGEQPYQSINQPGSIVSHTWDTPKNFSGTWDSYAGFVPEGSPVAAKAGFTGAVVRMTAVDPKDK